MSSICSDDCLIIGKGIGIDDMIDGLNSFDLGLKIEKE
jgi:hypothetical protein